MILEIEKKVFFDLLFSVFFGNRLNVFKILFIKFPMLIIVIW